MNTFIKAQAASFIASVVDYGLTILLKEEFNLWYLAAIATGTVAGGLTNFYVSRFWVFRGGIAREKTQLWRYFLVWTGYLFLATSGSYCVTHFASVNYIISKVIITFLLAVFWNYPLQKRYVFR